MKNWTLLKFENIFTDQWLTISKNEYKTDEGKIIGDQIILRRDGFVVIVAIQDNQIIVGDQFRPATDKFYISLPAGFIDGDEDVIEAAKRELLEETGYQAKDCKLIGKLDPLPGYIDSSAHIVLAIIEGEQGEVKDKDELRGLRKIDINQAIEMIKKGEIDEMQAVSAILLAKQFLS